MRPTRLFMWITAMVLLVGAAMVVPLPYFLLETPGAAIGLDDRIQIEAPSAEPIDGDFLYTTVLLAQTSLSQLVDAWLDPNVGIVRIDDVIPPGQSPDQYFVHQQLIFDQSARRGAAVGLRAAGFEIPPDAFGGDGALVVAVVAGSASDGVLLPGDVILAVNGEQTTTDDELRGKVLGQPLRLTVRRTGEVITVEVTPRPVPSDLNRPVLGVEVMTLNATIDLPVPVNVNSGDTGGPSAGLMIALAVFDKMDPVDLAGGRLIAGTGTIGFDGTVGMISGIEQKVLAAHREGVDVFLAPHDQLMEAQRGVPVGSGLRVIGVATFDEAVQALQPELARTG
jgi:Lon-like protease